MSFMEDYTTFRGVAGQVALLTMNACPINEAMCESTCVGRGGIP